MTEEEIIAAKFELETIKDIEEGYALTQKEYDRLHYETDAIKELRKTQVHLRHCVQNYLLLVIQINEYWPVVQLINLPIALVVLLTFCMLSIDFTISFTS